MWSAGRSLFVLAFTHSGVLRSGLSQNGNLSISKMLRLLSFLFFFMRISEGRDGIWAVGSGDDWEQGVCLFSKGRER